MGLGFLGRVRVRARARARARVRVRVRPHRVAGVGQVLLQTEGPREVPLPLARLEPLLEPLVESVVNE